MESRGGSPWKLSDFFKFGLRKDAFSSIAVVDTYQPSGQYHKDVMGSESDSPWKLSDFFKFGVREDAFSSHCRHLLSTAEFA